MAELKDTLVNGRLVVTGDIKANNRKVVTSPNGSAIGSTTIPIYIDANGYPQLCNPNGILASYTIGSSGSSTVSCKLFDIDMETSSAQWILKFRLKLNYTESSANPFAIHDVIISGYANNYDFVHMSSYNSFSTSRIKNIIYSSYPFRSIIIEYDNGGLPAGLNDEYILEITEAFNIRQINVPATRTDIDLSDCTYQTVLPVNKNGYTDSDDVTIYTVDSGAVPGNVNSTLQSLYYIAFIATGKNYLKFNWDLAGTKRECSGGTLKATYALNGSYTDFYTLTGAGAADLSDDVSINIASLSGVQQIVIYSIASSNGSDTSSQIQRNIINIRNFRTE